jgi:hypothetical protein
VQLLTQVLNDKRFANEAEIFGTELIAKVLEQEKV